MAIESDFKELMTQYVTIAPYSSVNNYGEPSFGSNQVYQARTVHKTRIVRTADGKEVVSTARTYIYGSPGISVKDQITLPDNTTPEILAADKIPDEDGDHHEVVYT